jgi:hypothetical protein
MTVPLCLAGAGGVEEDEGGAGGGVGYLRDSQMMENLVRLSLYVWLVQVVLRKMKEEQEEE